eukprot:SAG11_NODE_2734_length_3030_cov_1.940293_3_plen_57_part_00
MDLGTDCVHQYHLDTSSGALTALGKPLLLGDGKNPLGVGRISAKRNSLQPFAIRAM